MGKSSRTPCPLLGGDRVVSDSKQLKPHGGLPDASQQWPGFSCEILPKHFFVFSLFVVKGGVLVLTWAAREGGGTTNPLTPLPRTVVQVREDPDPPRRDGSLNAPRAAVVVVPQPCGVQGPLGTAA